MKEKIILLKKKDILNNKISFSIKQGIYFLISNNDIVYIGSSDNIIERISAHKNKKFDYYFYIETNLNKEELTKLEYKYIKRFKPIYNKVMTYKKQDIKNKKFNFNEINIRDINIMQKILEKATNNFYKKNINKYLYS